MFTLPRDEVFIGMDVHGEPGVGRRKVEPVEVAHHDIHDLTTRMAAIDPARATSKTALMARASRIDGISPQQMDLTTRCALALRDIAKAGTYDALAVSDWPALRADPGMHPGAAFTWIAEVDRIPVASEGDILGAVTQLAAKSLTARSLTAKVG